MNSRQEASLIILFSALGFFLNFIWEYVQCAPFFRHGEGNPNLASMLLASLGDVVMMFLIYFAVSLIRGSLIWLTQDWSFKTVVIVVVPSMALAVLVEFAGLNTARWTYTSRNPVIPWIGVSVLPILQMVFINPISFYVSKKMYLHFANTNVNQWRQYEK